MPAILTSPDLAALPGIRHGFFTRAWGNPNLSQADRVNAVTVRAAMAAALGTDADHLLSPRQTHSTVAVTVTEPWSLFDNPEGDALVTDRPGIALGVATADCVPVLLADAQAGVIGAAHAGWRGAVGGILDATLDAMRQLGASPARIVAALGPCIAQASYEVGPEFPAPFLAQDPANAAFFVPAIRAGHFLFDLPGYVAARLRAAGLVAVTPPSADTCADPERFFSHRYATLRGQARAGNLLSVIMLNGPER